MSLDQQQAPSASSWMLTMPEPLIEKLLANTRFRTVQRGEYIFRQGEPPEGIYRVLQGVISVQSPEGRSLKAKAGGVRWSPVSGINRWGSRSIASCQAQGSSS